LANAQERHPGDPEKEQQRLELRGTVPQRVYNGA